MCDLVTKCFFPSQTKIYANTIMYLIPLDTIVSINALVIFVIQNSLEKVKAVDLLGMNDSETNLLLKTNFRNHK